MALSVIIPAYNRAHTLARALESVRAQRLGDCEVILGDDASTDGTAEVAREIFPEIKVTRLPVNTGAAAARNAALKLARGEFIAFLDSDDEWLPGKLEAQLTFLKEHPEVGICASGHWLVTKEGSELPRPGWNFPNWPMALCFAQSFHGPSTAVVRAGVIEKVGPQDERLRVLEDWDWMLRASRVTRLHVLPEKLARIHENSPSPFDRTLVSTRLFLEKHEGEFARFGWAVHRAIRSQHWENAARCAFLHGFNGSGIALLWRSLWLAPWRNPASAAALPLALWCAATRSDFLKRVLRGRMLRGSPAPA